MLDPILPAHRQYGDCKLSLTYRGWECWSPQKRRQVRLLEGGDKMEVQEGEGSSFMQQYICKHLVYVYIYICMHACALIHMYVYTHIEVHTYVQPSVYDHFYTCLFIYIGLAEPPQASLRAPRRGVQKPRGDKRNERIIQSLKNYISGSKDSTLKTWLKFTTVCIQKSRA